MSRRPDACAPPPRIWISGSGSVAASPPPRWRHSGSPAAAAAACAAAIDTAMVALPPSRRFSGVPSSSISRASIAAWSAASRPISAGAMTSVTLATARVTSSPPNASPPSRRSTASPLPVDAPAGAIARPTAPPARCSSASTVGRPRLSQTRRPQHLHDRRMRSQPQLHRPGLAHRGQGVGGCDQEGAGQAPHPLLVRQRSHVLDRRLAVDPGQEQAGQQARRARLELGRAAPSRPRSR